MGQLTAWSETPHARKNKIYSGNLYNLRGDDHTLDLEK